MAVVPHDFRAAYATSLLDSENDISVVADLLGHADIKTTKIYDRRGEKARKKAIKKLGF